MIVVMQLQQWVFKRDLSPLFPVEAQCGKAIGFLPVFASEADARAAFPGAPWVFLEARRDR